MTPAKPQHTAGAVGVAIPLSDLVAKRLPRCCWSSIFTAQDDTAARDAAEHLDKYLSQFVPPQDGFDCIGCGSKLTGLFGSFVYGLAHGEGSCRVCDYPTRMLHRFEVGPVQFLRFPLQYHPDELSESEPAQSEAR